MKDVDSSLYERLQVRQTNPNAWCSADYPQFEKDNSVKAHNTLKGKVEIITGNKLALLVLGNKDMFGKFLFKDVKNLPNNIMPDDPVTVSDGSETVSAEELEYLMFSTLDPAFVKRITRFRGENAASHLKQALFIWHFVLHPALAVEISIS